MQNMKTCISGEKRQKNTVTIKQKVYQGEARMNIFGFFKKIPGGSLLIPMLISAIINTVSPEFWTTLGGTSNATFKGGSLCIVGIIMFGMGANTNIKTLGAVLKRNGFLALAKLAIGLSFGVLFLKLFGLDGINGISAVAFVTCICSSNPGVYLGIVSDYGEQIDTGNVPIMTILDMPIVPLVILAIGGAGFNVLEVFTVIIPYALGILLGNLDSNFAQAYSTIPTILLPFLGFNFGSSLNLLSAFRAGIAGIVLGIVYMILNVPILLLADRYLNKRPGYAGVAMCSVAGISLAIPAMLGESFTNYQASAVSQIAMCLVVSCILCPILTKIVVSKWGSAKNN